jgi:hypothetical protein
MADTSSELSRGVCGFFAVECTDEPGRVTCRVCLRRMHAEREAIPEYVDDRWFIEQTQKPLRMSNLTAKEARVWRYALDGCARIITETSADDRPRIGIMGTRAPFASVSDAFARLVMTRLDGYADTSAGDPDRIKRLTGQLGGFSAPVGAVTSKAQGQAEMAAEAQRALDHAYRRPWDSPPVAAQSCREMLLLKLVGGRTDAEIAGDMLERDVAVKAGDVRRITRWGFAQAWEWLMGRGLIPSPDGRVVRVDCEVDAVTKSQCTDADLFGWDEIATFLGQSKAAAQKWAREDAMPIRRFKGRVEAKSDELRAWRERQTVRPPSSSAA